MDVPNGKKRSREEKTPSPPPTSPPQAPPSPPRKRNRGIMLRSPHGVRGRAPPCVELFPEADPEAGPGSSSAPDAHPGILHTQHAGTLEEGALVGMDLDPNILIQDGDGVTRGYHSLGAAEPRAAAAGTTINAASIVTPPSSLSGTQRNVDDCVRPGALVRCYFRRNTKQTRELPELRNFVGREPANYVFVLTGALYNWLHRHKDTALASPGIMESSHTVFRAPSSAARGAAPAVKIGDALVYAETLEGGAKLPRPNDFSFIYLAISGVRAFFDRTHATSVVIRLYNTECVAQKALVRCRTAAIRHYARATHLRTPPAGGASTKATVAEEYRRRSALVTAPRRRSLHEWREEVVRWARTDPETAGCAAALAWDDDKHEAALRAASPRPGFPNEARAAWYRALSDEQYPMGAEYEEAIRSGDTERLLDDVMITPAVASMPTWPASDANPLRKAVAERPISFATFAGMIEHVRVLVALKERTYQQWIANHSPLVHKLAVSGFGPVLYRIAVSLDTIRKYQTN